ncbi:MAG TPA: HEPN domain-containing protein [Phycisphaerae bacterium]|jgi:hypothetical protein|nr:HEPN domain-containing protein [Phycisphaerae bacterium]
MVPRSVEARRFYFVARQRLEDGQLLLHELARPAAAVYLAGYAVECILKALLLANTTPDHARAVAAEFRGAWGHDLQWLGARLRKAGVAGFPAAISRDLALVSTWSVELRYNPRMMPERDAEAFVAAVERIVAFMDARIS